MRRLVSYTTSMHITIIHWFTAAGNASISSTQLPWNNLAKTTAEQSRQIVNWPEGVPFPGEGIQQGQKKSGIKALSTAVLTRLYKASCDSETAPRVIHADREGRYFQSIRFYIPIISL
jgi:hypothetical protein